MTLISTKLRVVVENYLLLKIGMPKLILIDNEIVILIFNKTSYHDEKNIDQMLLT